MVIKGEIEDIIFRNNENLYTVILLDVNGEPITAVGKFPQVAVGELVELTGSFTTNKYGEQFSVHNIKIVPPNTVEGIIKYLSSGLIKGVGEITATNIVAGFGEKTLEVIEFAPHKLLEIRGISQRKLEDIISSFREVRDMQNAVMLMQSHNITTNMAMKIYKVYQNKTERLLKENPYKLVEDVEGIGFYTADKIAQKMGVDKDSVFRVRAGILHLLKENSDRSGNTYILLDRLVSSLDELLQMPISEKVTDILAQMVLEGLVKQFKNAAEQECVMLVKLYNIEKLIAATINLFSLNELPQYNVEEEISLYQKLNKIKLHATQIEALSASVNNSVSVITGGPGTGKTTIVKCLMYLFGNMGKKVKLVAPTGRAAKRLSESTGAEASTIHRALEVDFNSFNRFNFNVNNKLTCDVIIIDEVSMVDVQLFFYLIRALRNGTQIVLVGDKDQLPSVGAGNLLGDIVSSEVVPVVSLTHIYRQDDDSLIITNAHAINNGKMPEINNKSKDFFFDYKESAEEMLKSVKNMQLTRIPQFLNIDNSRIQVLSAMKNGTCGVDNLNRVLQESINPPSLSKPELVSDKYIYRVNDRVMQITNNYEREWRKDGYVGSGVFNGDIGKITDINRQTGEVYVEFEDGRRAMYARPDLAELMLSYAITIHKSQGSEFDVVIIPLVNGAPMLLSRNLLYTAVTRAKSMVVIVGTTKTMKMMIRNNKTQERYTMLKEFLVQGKETPTAFLS